MDKFVAVYGSLRQGLGNHRVLGASQKVGKTRIKGWDMFSLGGFPGIKSGGGEITIEVYHVVDDHVSQALDWLEGHRGKGDPNNFYDKEVVETEFGPAEIYTLQDYQAKVPVPEGDWCEYRAGVLR